MERLWVDLADACQDIVDEILIDRLLSSLAHLLLVLAHQRMQLAVSASLIYQVDGLIGQEAVVDVLRACLDSIA